MIDYFGVFIIGSISFLVFALIRNTWVHIVRTRVIYEKNSRYKQLPDYDFMLLKFWVWDVEKFLKGDPP